MEDDLKQINKMNDDLKKYKKNQLPGLAWDGSLTKSVPQ